MTGRLPQTPLNPEEVARASQARFFAHQQNTHFKIIQAVFGNRLIQLMKKHFDLYLVITDPEVLEGCKNK
jgi:hypothetical protein